MKTFITRLAQARPATSLFQARLLVLPSIRLSSTSSPSSDPTSTQSTTSLSSQATTIDSEPRPNLQFRPYLIGITPSSNYPVYTRTKSAGQSKFTLIKKIEGNKKAFMQDLANETGLDASTMIINPVTGHVQLKGFHVDKVKEWLGGLFGDPRKPKPAEEESVP